MFDNIYARVDTTGMEEITGTTKNSDIIRNHDAFGLMMDAAVALVTARMAELRPEQQRCGLPEGPEGRMD
jgi:hypothetical protein